MSLWCQAPLLGKGDGRGMEAEPSIHLLCAGAPSRERTRPSPSPGVTLCESTPASLSLISSPHRPSHLVVNMKAELQELMNMLRKLQGAIDFGNAPMAEREELAGDVAEIMDTLFELMKKLPDE